MPDLFSLIDKHEGAGNYSTLFGHSQREGGQFAGVDPSKMTIGELLEFQDPSGKYGQWVKGQVGHVATPAGRHQIVGKTLRNASNEMGLSMDTPFDANTQDSIAKYLARRRLRGAKSPEAKRAALRSEWEGFKNVSDVDLNSAIASFEGGAPMGVPKQAGLNERASKAVDQKREYRAPPIGKKLHEGLNDRIGSNRMAGLGQMLMNNGFNMLENS